MALNRFEILGLVILISFLLFHYVAFITPVIITVVRLYKSGILRYAPQLSKCWTYSPEQEISLLLQIISLVLLTLLLIYKSYQLVVTHGFSLVKYVWIYLFCGISMYFGVIWVCIFRFNVSNTWLILHQVGDIVALLPSVVFCILYVVSDLYIHYKLHKKDKIPLYVIVVRVIAVSLQFVLYLLFLFIAIVLWNTDPVKYNHDIPFLNTVSIIEYLIFYVGFPFLICTIGFDIWNGRKVEHHYFYENL